eukprot:m.154755 g.154755  ORF g.154755 m.154755 type:complete len:355 (+) comp30908_c0_seq1:193-1257(+)
MGKVADGSLVGCRIVIDWDDEQVSYVGKVVEHRDGLHRIRYEQIKKYKETDKLWHDLRLFEWSRVHDSEEDTAALDALYREPVHIFLKYYSPIWIWVLGFIVYFGWWKQFDGDSYLYLGILLATPCFIGPELISRYYIPASRAPNVVSYPIKFIVWIGILTVLASWFGTHYFYAILGVRYTFPEGLEANHVPVSMYLMAIPYFCTYHWFAALVLNNVGHYAFVVVLMMAYVTAFFEALSMSAFPHYYYPDREAMLSIGSLFYALLFVVSYPMYTSFSRRAHALTLWQTAVDSLAASMLILCLYEAWRTIIGPISDAVDPTVCPPFTHPVDGTIPNLGSLRSKIAYSLLNDLDTL